MEGGGRERERDGEMEGMRKKRERGTEEVEGERKVEDSGYDTH